MFGDRIVFAVGRQERSRAHAGSGSQALCLHCVICRFFGGRPQERAAVCHMRRTGGALAAPVYASGDTAGQDSWCGLGEVWGRDGADMGAHAGGGDGITDGRQ